MTDLASQQAHFCPTRRKLLVGLAGGAAWALAPPLLAADDFWSRPRQVDLYRLSTGEAARCTYWQDGGISASGYQQACWLLRDVRANQMIAMHPRLLDLLCAMQAWVGHYGFPGAIQVLSGYRTAHTNAHTEGAARNSMHMYGAAADIRFPGLPMSYLGKLAQSYAAGGVGFYVQSDFVHVDTGRIRTWRK